MKLEQAISELFDTFARLNSSLEQFKKKSQLDHHLPVYLPQPQFDNSCAIKKREIAIMALSQLWHKDKQLNLPLSGFLSISPETAATVTTLNHHKKIFQQQIKVIRNLSKGHSTLKNHGKIVSLLEQLLSQAGLRTPSLRIALQQLHIERLNLQRCYCQLRLLPNQLESVSWTWAKQHSEIQQISVKEAQQIYQALPDDHRLKTNALLQLSTLPSSEKLAYKRDKKKQLRANICWQEASQIKRKAVTVSGILLSTDTTLPRFRWPDDNDHSRLSRMDQKISDQALIPGLHLYRYNHLKNP